MADTTTETETVHIIVGWNDDYEQHFTYLGNKAEVDHDSRLWGFDVPAALWNEYELLSEEAENARKAVIAATDIDDDAPRLKTCCTQWRGEITPARSWWFATLTASENDDEWPVRDAGFGPHHKSEAAAQEFIDSLPDSFQALPAHGGAVVLVTKDRLTVEAKGFGEYSSSCRDCGWDREAHPA